MTRWINLNELYSLAPYNTWMIIELELPDGDILLVPGYRKPNQNFKYWIKPEWWDDILEEDVMRAQKTGWVMEGAPIEYPFDNSQGVVFTGPKNRIK